ncbi:hypothetical protein [Halalkalibacter hemicellulosilyticus]|uniref:Uncharacterized protein n=1 Tax=Halalkalibacter hemicellulosilyticusJCM 9152 TaxID=1236971 RepID=W4QHW0_9BACI|nr:hypothetical protein [Halalkalibacter hemicellulosilyticus]GAE31243.1 hypothetical protein JCM9152_2699 [Halalkalibacter hemicellulosilyticusJCM 9152]
MIRLFFLILGFVFAVIGGISLVAYLNLLTTGYEFSMYVSFIIRRVELYVFLIGLILILLSITYEISWRKRVKKRR